MKRVIAPILLLALGTTLLIQLPIAIAGRASEYEWFDPILDIRRILVDRYVEPPDEEAMQLAMIDGMIEQLDDPYTQYIPPADIDAFNKQLRGTYAGIGAEVNIRDGYLVIVTPMDDSPALHAGVLAGDVVLEIEGESTYEMPVSDCVDRLTGDIGTEVHVRVRHLDDTEEDLAIRRDRIVTRTVRGLRRRGEAWSYCVDDALGLSYVHVTQFNDSTVSELSEALDSLGPARLQGLILDLRDNPGGGLPTAVAMADLFLRSGTIVRVEPRVGDPSVYAAQADGTLPDFPMIVLVNDQSASASEIVSGALQDNGRAKVVGMRTYGKGSVQEVRTLSYGAGTLKYTTAHYYLPSGRNINRMPGSEVWGVDPDPGFTVPVSDEEALDRFRARRDYEIIREPDEDFQRCVPPGWIRENLKDEQLAVAVEALQDRVRTGSWPERPSTVEPGQVAVNTDLKRLVDARARGAERLRDLEQQIEELEQVAERQGRKPALPADADLVDGTITIRNRDGRLIGTYEIEAGNLALALDAVMLRPVETGEEQAPPEGPKPVEQTPE